MSDYSRTDLYDEARELQRQEEEKARKREAQERLVKQQAEHRAREARVKPETPQERLVKAEAEHRAREAETTQKTITRRRIITERAEVGRRGAERRFTERQREQEHKDITKQAMNLMEGQERAVEKITTGLRSRAEIERLKAAELAIEGKPGEGLYRYGVSTALRFGAGAVEVGTLPVRPLGVYKATIEPQVERIKFAEKIKKVEATPLNIRLSMMGIRPAGAGYTEDLQKAILSAGYIKADPVGFAAELAGGYTAGVAISKIGSAAYEKWGPGARERRQIQKLIEIEDTTSHEKFGEFKEFFKGDYDAEKWGDLDSDIGVSMPKGTFRGREWKGPEALKTPVTGRAEAILKSQKPTDASKWFMEYLKRKGAKGYIKKRRASAVLLPPGFKKLEVLKDIRPVITTPRAIDYLAGVAGAGLAMGVRQTQEQIEKQKRAMLSATRVDPVLETIQKTRVWKMAGYGVKEKIWQLPEHDVKPIVWQFSHYGQIQRQYQFPKQTVGQVQEIEQIQRQIPFQIPATAVRVHRPIPFKPQIMLRKKGRGKPLGDLGIERIRIMPVADPEKWLRRFIK